MFRVKMPQTESAAHFVREIGENNTSNEVGRGGGKKKRKIRKLRKQENVTKCGFREIWLGQNQLLDGVGVNRHSGEQRESESRSQHSPDY